MSETKMEKYQKFGHVPECQHRQIIKLVDQKMWTIWSQIVRKWANGWQWTENFHNCSFYIEGGKLCDQCQSNKTKINGTAKLSPQIGVNHHINSSDVSEREDYLLCKDYT